MKMQRTAEYRDGRRPRAEQRYRMDQRPRSERQSRMEQRPRPERRPRVERPPKRRRGINRDNVITALWLWCFPVGLSKMWRSRCTWPKPVKVFITALMAAVLAAVFIVPTPKKTALTGVQLVVGNPEVEVYGPALPALVVAGYTSESTGSIIVDEVSSDVHYVYAADGARCYHEYECKFAFASSQRLTVYEAYHLGFEPCGLCNPPVYTPGLTDPITAEPIQGTTTYVDTTVEPAEETVPEA